MKQPELGRKIAELRKAKGLTQEELVEKCNISVRTIQRIECGEVTPRSYTVKTILAALDYDLGKIKGGEENIFASLVNWLKKLLLINIEIDKPSDYLIKHLNFAWIFGIIYFILGFFEAAAEYFRFERQTLIFGSTLYVIMKALILISYIFFQRGFIMLGGLFKNYLLKISSFISLAASTLLIGYDITSIFYDSFERQFILGCVALTFGGIGILYGVALYRLRHAVGESAKFAGIFEIIASCFFLTILLSFIGHIFLIPAELLEIIVIFKAIEIIKSKQTEE